VSAKAGLEHLYCERPERTGRDRLEILTALINAPSFDPIYRCEVIRIPRGHPVYRWECLVDGCGRTRSGAADLCHTHRQEFADAGALGVGKAAFLRAAQGLDRFVRLEQARCQVCPGRPAIQAHWLLCQRHYSRWFYHRRAMGQDCDLDQWLAGQESFDGFGVCRVRVCPDLADSPLGLCSGHASRYDSADSPGGASLPRSWSHRFERQGLVIPVLIQDERRFRDWCAREWATPWPGQINLAGLRPLLRAELQWSLFTHARTDRPGRWDLGWIQKLVNLVRDRDAGSLTDVDLADFPRFYAAIVRVMLHHLRLIYFTPDQTREAGFIETDHFGVRFPHRASHIDLTGIGQRWLRDLLWDHLADLMRSPRCPRTGKSIDAMRRAATELSAFLQVEAPGGGHDPGTLRPEHAQRFVADQRHRARGGLASLVMKGPDGSPSTVTTTTWCVVANGVRKLLRDALESGDAERLALDREFITAMPTAGYTAGRVARRPFPDEVAQALADPTNLARLAHDYDPDDRGLRDVWETIVATGRRVGEVLAVRWDCLGRYGGLAMFWHDQTKVGNYDVAIRIPEHIYTVLAERQRKTLDRFTARHGIAPTAAQRAGLALFPSPARNGDGTTALTHQWFHRAFSAWIAELDLGHYVPHQARHTMATNLLRSGASLTHIRRYLGQVSDRMAEHYVHLSHSDLEDVLQHVWVAGPGTAAPGQLLTGDITPLTREQAQALAIDLSRRATPAEGGFCTFQPVVAGGACPWNLDCHTCDKFVLSGADLLYWRRKRQQWRQLAEGAPDDATADYLHRYFEPTAQAIDGLEKALAGLGLLDEALALDLRKPQDYFQRIWATAFRAHDLIDAAQDTSDVLHDEPDNDGQDLLDDTEEPCA
jgi:integrase